MQIPTLNKFIKSNQNKFIMETNALKELLRYLLFVIVIIIIIVIIITTTTSIVPLLIGKETLKPHIFLSSEKANLKYLSLMNCFIV